MAHNFPNFDAHVDNPPCVSPTMTESIQRQPVSIRKRHALPLDNEAYDSSTSQKYRNLINQHLGSIGKEWDTKLGLDQRGMCSFQCGSFVVVIEVPWDSKTFFLYTCIMKCLPSSTAVMRKALELNYLTQTTNGCTLSLDPTKPQDMEITLCHSHRIDGSINPSSLINLVKNFLRTATSIQKELDRAQRSRISFMTALPLRQQQTSRGGKSSRKGRRNKKPPPAPRDKDVTPTISNKTTDKIVVHGVRRNDSIQTIQKATPLKDYAKMNVALGLTMAAATGHNPYSLAAKAKARSTNRSQEGVMRRLSRMASKSIRPRASFGRHRPQPETILEDVPNVHGLEI